MEKSITTFFYLITGYLMAVSTVAENLDNISTKASYLSRKRKIIFLAL